MVYYTPGVPVTGLEKSITPLRHVGIVERYGLAKHYNADTGVFISDFSIESDASDINQISYSNNYVYIYDGVTGDVKRFNHDGSYLDTLFNGGAGCTGLLVTPDDSFIYLIYVTPGGFMPFPPFFTVSEYDFLVYTGAGAYVGTSNYVRFISDMGIGCRAGSYFLWAIVSANSVPMDTDYDWWEGRGDLTGGDALLPTGVPTLSIPAPIFLRGAYQDDADFAFYVSDTLNICYRYNLTTGNIDSSFETAASTLFDAECDAEGNLYVLGNSTGNPEATLYKYAAGDTGTPTPVYVTALNYPVSEIHQMFFADYTGMTYTRIFIKPWGDDATADGTIQKPYKTLLAAISAVTIFGYYLMDVGDVTEVIAGVLDVTKANFRIQLHPLANIHVDTLAVTANKDNFWKGGTISITQILDITEIPV